jgi:2-polyprenyl-6-methoxyphenol hydroxylase-like FAD-dependent oxidoreductase
MASYPDSAPRYDGGMHPLSDSKSHAIIIGGSMTGMMAAQVLTRHFAKVTIIDRDFLPDDESQRRGTPQAIHLHNVVTRGWMVLEQLFRGIQEELIDADAPPISWPADLMWLGRKGWSPRFEANITTYSCTRNLLETKIRHRIQREGIIDILPQTSVTGVLTDESGKKITGVKIRGYHHQQGLVGEEAHILGSLVVDASGRSSRTPQWLEELGYKPPRQSIVKPYVGYSTRHYVLPHDQMPDWKVLLVQSRPPHSNHSAGLFRVENNHWTLTLVGMGGDYPPSDEEGFMELLRNLPDPKLYEFVKTLQPTSPIYTYRIPQNRVVHFEKMSRRPENLIAIGDAVCGFNPVYGHGISVAAQSVSTLHKSLRQQIFITRGSLTGFAQLFHDNLASVVSAPWVFTTGEDMRYPTTEGGDQSVFTQAAHWYVDGVMDYALDSPDTHRALIQVMHLLKSPLIFLRPDIVINAIATNVGRWNTR